MKGAWSECDPKNNMRSRTLTLKKGDQSNCEGTKTIQKKCKKGKIFIVLSGSFRPLVYVFHEKNL